MVCSKWLLPFERLRCVKNTINNAHFFKIKLIKSKIKQNLMIISNHKVSYKDASNQRGLRSNPQVIRGPNTKLSKLKMVTPTSYHFHASKLCVLAQWSKKIYLRLRANRLFRPFCAESVDYLTKRYDFTFYVQEL